VSPAYINSVWQNHHQPLSLLSLKVGYFRSTTEKLQHVFVVFYHQTLSFLSSKVVHGKVFIYSHSAVSHGGSEKMNPIQTLKGAVKSLKRDRHGNVQYIGALILGLVVAMITILIAELLGGVLSAQIATLYDQFNLTGTVWQGLFTQTQTIATSAISVAVIGFLIAAFMVVIGIFAGGGRRR
jgi:hypothetical protein